MQLQNFLFIRPSGNLLSLKGFEEMMNSGDVCYLGKSRNNKNTYVCIP
tara:strand:- start:518 stop:661 length:144 start_codon:yes stop_codon:yes gene_type:complete